MQPKSRITFANYLNSVSARLVHLRATKQTGVFTCGCELQAGKPRKCDKRFAETRVLRREEIEHASPAAMLQKVYKQAVALDSGFFGRIEVEIEIFQGIVVDTRKGITQTFQC